MISTMAQITAPRNCLANISDKALTGSISRSLCKSVMSEIFTEPLIVQRAVFCCFCRWFQFVLLIVEAQMRVQ